MAINKRFAHLNHSGSNHSILDAESAYITGTLQVGPAVPALGSDVNFFVSGAKDGEGKATPGVGVFGGDLVVSGNLHFLGGITGSIPTSASYWTSPSLGVIKAEASSSMVEVPHLSASNGAEVTGSFTQGDNTIRVIGSYSHAQGRQTTAYGDYSHAEGWKTSGSGDYSHAEGSQTEAYGNFSHAEGLFTFASGSHSHAEGDSTNAFGDKSHAEGNYTLAYGTWSHAEGYYTTASGYNSHAEGIRTEAQGNYSHAEGSGSFAIGVASHAEGNNNLASGWYSHAEGTGTEAAGKYSHAEGTNTVALGTGSHAEGLGAIASGSYQHVQGKFNKRGNDFSLFVVGDGTTDADVDRHDVLRVNSGEVQVTGSLIVVGDITGSIHYVDPANTLPFLKAGPNIYVNFEPSGQWAITGANESQPELYYIAGSDPNGTAATSGSLVVSGALVVTGAVEFSPAGTGRGLLKFGGLDIGPITGSITIVSGTQTSYLGVDILSASNGAGPNAVVEHEMHVLAVGALTNSSGIVEHFFSATYLVTSKIDNAGVQSLIGSVELTREASGSYVNQWDVNVESDMKVALTGTMNNNSLNEVRWFVERTRERSKKW